MSQPTDPIVWMKRNLHTVPPQAVAAFNAANVARTNPKRLNVIPQAATAQLYPRPPKAEPEDPQTFAPAIAAHVRAGLRNFKSGRAAQDALMTLRDAMERLHGNRDSRAARYLKARGLQPLNIATTLTPAAGGYTTPDAVTGAIQLRLAETGAARLLPTVVPVKSGQATVPVLEEGPTVYYVDEAAEIPDSTPTIGALGVHVEKRGVLIKVTNELLEDSDYAVLDMFITATSNALRAVEDDELINGDGTSTYGGEVGLLASLGAGGVVTAATGHDTWAEITAADIAALVGLLPEQYAHPDNAFLTSTPFFAYMAAAVPAAVSFDAQGRPMFMGKRVILSEKMPRTTAASQVSLLYGDFPNAVVFADRGIRFETSDLERDAFIQDLTLLRAVSRYDLVVQNMGDASNAGAVVALKTSA